MTYSKSEQLLILRGVISLAWADHSLSAEEQEMLQRLIDNNTHLSDKDKASLHKEIMSPAPIDDIWKQMHEKTSRAHLLNIASNLFWSDGDFSAHEKELLNQLERLHLESLNAPVMKAELSELAKDLRQKNDADTADFKEWRLTRAESFMFGIGDPLAHVAYYLEKKGLV